VADHGTAREGPFRSPESLMKARTKRVTQAKRLGHCEHGRYLLQVSYPRIKRPQATLTLPGLCTGEHDRIAPQHSSVTSIR
jgi:hypothetical protein